MRLVWLAVNSSFSHSSLALPVLHLAARQLENWDWERIETTIADHPVEIAVRLAELQPDLVCASLYLFNSQAVFSILERFKTLCPACPVVVGGPECLGEGAADVLRRSQAPDCAVSGEGESCLPLILESIGAGRFPEEYPGALCRSGTPAAAAPAAAPLHYRDWENAAAPLCSPFFNTGKPFVQMETSRGCPQGCIYCTSCHTPVRCKTIPQVQQELRLLAAKGVREIRLLDRTFNLPAERAAALLRLFRNEFPQIRFHLEIHPQFLNEELRRELLLAKPGQLHLEAGIQSLKPDVLQAAGRSGQAGQALQGLAFLCSCPAFDTHADLLAGLPKQSFPELLEDVSTLISTGPAEIQLEILKVLPGTPLRRQAAGQGIRFNPNPPYEVLQTPVFSARELLQASLLSRALDVFYNQPLLQKPFRLACRNYPDFLKNFLVFLQSQAFSLQWTGSLKKRFQLLAGFITAETSASAVSLAVHWLKAGLPPAETPFHRPEMIRVLPENAVLLEGGREAAGLSDTRLWQLDTGAGFFVFAFNRGLSMQTPCAVWQLPPV